MAKPDHIDGYDDGYTAECERVLVTLLAGLGPWKDSVYLIGGLVPRYLVRERPPNVPPHAGTLDVDVVIALEILADTQAYHTLEENLKHMQFERSESNGRKVSWRWQARTERGMTVVLELIADDPETSGGRVQALPTNGNISALNIPHASMVFDLHEVTEIRAQLLGDNGIATEQVRYANLVSFTCLKAFAFDQRHERKDAHDLVYCLECAPGGVEAAAQQFRDALGGPYTDVVDRALHILETRFVSDAETEGHLKDGPVAVSKFEHLDTSDTRERRVLRQREASDVVEALLRAIGR
ncbi:antitoxin [Ralstonia solanacearum]|uniref:Antitoxin n=1 Tax=Ralstonia solanacearum TaxID=305 RepID=A0AAE3NJG5_RALSL|nr:antitoxin [Ralstonia solanacearum]MBB6584466.1 antitoxin [Ralstonia solanacearum]MDB0521571.1 antitoxin [Ralstonia solanacearum]